jgi:hypothetical protein
MIMQPESQRPLDGESVPLPTLPLPAPSVPPASGTPQDGSTPPPVPVPPAATVQSDVAIQAASLVEVVGESSPVALPPVIGVH